MSLPKEIPPTAIDIVLCIDVTGSMASIIETVKKDALTFHSRLTEEIAAKGKSLGQLRVKVIAFRDFGDRADDAIQESEFFVLPRAARPFKTFVGALRATGGGDAPESALEALALAIQAPWERELPRARHVIVMFTDAAAHPLGKHKSKARSHYPQHIAQDFDELFAQWGHEASTSALMDASAKQLVLFAPADPPWTDIADDWDDTLHAPSRAGNGLEEVDIKEIISTIAYRL
ncbi:VWA domain-containing protein [Frankia sp. CNm7]|uniref:VWA domain-containing protein n=1 Tax=Frankia nepalensis TaxID=1836974 RepID=A0A937RQ90_9ACTN|nr:vWA domain-containing protein [Frankia nepalensis]MBL7495876.1 VWA domain-containing protein [Frankia nepalensis]MBL7510397.1 VWA domain-containing protein [Frankia nepalensis]MBL7518625.1 VWA domain-containing protein [Frankia nepalensis]MBL7629996.1 VWA domain-containing protein [Frankia nepalensis]